MMASKESWYTPEYPLLGRDNGVRREQSKWKRLGATVLLIILGYFWYNRLVGQTQGSKELVCPQATALLPQENVEIASELADLFETDGFRRDVISWLSGAVQVPTESFDEMGPIGEDPRWEAFGPFHDYLNGAFPMVHKTLKLTKVNTYGLLYHWQGSDDSLKPLLLAAHQDVVPVEPDTVSQWIHPPYSGHFDGKWIWGRGSGDDKSGLIGIMSAVELLISKGFKPTRTIVLAFGFDEEASGAFGARALSREMLKVYGKDSMAMIIDEGGGYREQYGTIFAEPAVAEKGYFDTKLEIKTPGGHSSVPPKHTSIGILSSLLVEFEENPIPAKLSRTTIPYATLQCLAEHAANLPCRVRFLIKMSLKSNWALRRLESLVFRESEQIMAKVGTTQAIDLINGGVKVNALPESAEAVVNHRIATDSSVSAVKKRDTKIVENLAKRFNLSLTAYGREIKTVDGPAYGTLKLTDAWGTALEPAPVSPIAPDAEPYKLLSGTIIATYEASPDSKANNTTIAVAPGISTGNTDTRYYWSLSRHIFRYNHKDARGSFNGAHTINEAITADSFLEMIRFFTTLILNADESIVI